MSTVKVKDFELPYYIKEDTVTVKILDGSCLSIKIEKITGLPYDEKKLSKRKLKEYLESSKMVKRSLKTLEE